MYKSFEIKNFKCFEHLKLENLARVNLIAGKNGVGKSALLEALYLHCDGHNPEILLTFIKPRRRPVDLWQQGISMTSLCRGFFRGFDTNQAIQMTGTNLGASTRTIELRLVDHPKHGASDRLALRLSGGGSGPFFVSLYGQSFRCDPEPPGHAVLAYFGGGISPIDPRTDSVRFSELTKAGHEQRILRTLRIVEPGLKGLELLVDEGALLLHGRVGLPQPVPLPEMGDGIRRLGSLVLELGVCGNGVLLVDEVENGLHYSVLEDVWRVIAEAARQFNVQVFATTHSRECVGAATEAFKESKSDELAFYRLVNIDGKIENTRYESETLADAIETGWEVR